MTTSLVRVRGPGSRLSLLLPILLALAVGVWGQLYTGSLTGVVSDPSGAVIPGAKATLTDTEKGFKYEAQSSPVGRFLFRNLPPGKYSIQVEAAGFKTYQQGGITLEVNQNANVDVAMQVGVTAETVEVVGTGAPLLSTEDAVTGQGLERSAINNLPLVNRAVFDLAFLAPGVSQPAGSSFGLNNSPNNFVSNGSRNATADIIMDGVSTVNYEQNSGIQMALYTPSVDAIQEFKVQQSNFSAEIGFSGSTILNVVFRSGTNDIHGGAYYFHRNSAFDANNFFNNMNGIDIPPLRWHQYGLNAGGPIKKNRTFFFMDWEGTRSTYMGTFDAGVPSAAERTGDFGELCTLRGGTFSPSGLCSVEDGQLWDPYTGVFNADFGGPVRTNFIPFNDMRTYMSPGNSKLPGSLQIPAKPGNLIDPVGYKMLQYYPLPNVAVGTPQYDFRNNWVGSGASKSTNDQFDVKVDHRFTDNALLAGRFSYGRGSWHGANCFGNVGDPCTQGPNNGGPTAGVLNYTHTLNPQTLFTLSYGLTRSWSFTKGVGEDFPDFDPVTTLGLPEYMKAAGVRATPGIYVAGYNKAAGNVDIGSQAWSFMRYGQEVHHLISSVSRVLDRHDLKFGGEMRVHRISFQQAGAPMGVFAYDFNSTSQYPWWGGGDAMAAIMIGTSTGGWGEYEIPLASSTQNLQYAGFVQDNWRVNDKLTLNLGVRYDVDLPRTERHNRMSWVDPNVPTGISAPGFQNLTGGLRFVDKNTRSPYDADYMGLGPRFGLSYRLTDKVVLRGGYGIFYSLSKGGAAGSGAGGFTGFDAVTNWNSYYQGDGETPYGFLRDPFGGDVLRPTGSSLGTLTLLGQGIGGPIRSWNIRPSEQTWSFGIQRELPFAMVGDINYVGKKGTHLYFANAGDLNHLTAAQAADFKSNPGYWNEYVDNPFYGIITDPNTSLSAPSVPRIQLIRPHPHFNGLSGNDPPWANSSYHGLQMRLDKRFSRGLTFLATYTWQKSIDDSSVAGGNVTWLGGTTGSVVQDPNNLHIERSLSQYDIAHIFQLSAQWELPIGRGKLLGGDMKPWLDAVIGGWQTNGIYRASGGQPIILYLSGGQSIPTFGGQRPNLIGTLKRSDNWTLDQYFADTSVVDKPEPYEFGTAPKTLSSVRSPGTNVASLSLFKKFSLASIREGMRFEIRLESFNAFNHPQFCGPATTVGLEDFGKITCQANSPREVQLGGKLYW